MTRESGPRQPLRRSSSSPSLLLKGLGAAGAATIAWNAIVSATSSVPDIWAGERIRTHVLPHCSQLLKAYKPSPWALNTHSQNVLGYIRGAGLNARYTRQLIIAHDGGTLGLDWFRGCDDWRWADPSTPVLLVLHGINGGSHEGYCKWMCACAAARGWRSVVLNYRGCNGLPLTSPRGYSATLTHDIHFAITSIKARFPLAPLFAVGYSLGGLFLTKYLGEADVGLHASAAAAASAFEPFEGSGLVAAAVVSTPVCLVQSSAALSKPWTAGYAYNMAVAFKMREFMAHHREQILAGTTLDVDKARSYWTVAEMEDAGIPATFGFENRAQYYEASASLVHIPHITTPTLFLVSHDDPFLGVLPDQECAANPNTILAATKRGGHVAFLQGWWPFGPAYMDRTVLQFLDAAWHHFPHDTARPSDSVPSVGGSHAAAAGPARELYAVMDVTAMAAARATREGDEAAHGLSVIGEQLTGSALWFEGRGRIARSWLGLNEDGSRGEQGVDGPEEVQMVGFEEGEAGAAGPNSGSASEAPTVLVADAGNDATQLARHDPVHVSPEPGPLAGHDHPTTADDSGGSQGAGQLHVQSSQAEGSALLGASEEWVRQVRPIYCVARSRL